MRETTNKYLNKIEKIQEECFEKDGNIKEEYKKKIEDIFKDISVKYIEEMRVEIENRYNPKNKKYQKELVDLKVLWYLFDDLGHEYIPILFNEFGGENWKAHAKIRLFMMFVKSFGEIIYLLEGGYASCGLSRIRYIYEIGVYLEIMQNNSQSISKRFLQFSNSNRIKLAKELENKKLQRKVVKDFKKIDNRRDAKEPYGWAKDIIFNEKITFRKLAKTTTLYEHYSMYTFSSWSIHADIYGSVNSIDRSSRENDRTWITGPSSLGTYAVINHLLLLVGSIPMNYFSVENEGINIFVLLIVSELVINISKTIKE